MDATGLCTRLLAKARRRASKTMQLRLSAVWECWSNTNWQHPACHKFATAETCQPLGSSFLGRYENRIGEHHHQSACGKAGGFSPPLVRLALRFSVRGVLLMPCSSAEVKSL